MSIKSRADLKAYVDAYIDTNGIDAISGAILNDFLNDFADSAINKNGDTGILGKLRYNGIFSINNDADLVHKKYVDDNSGSKEVTDAPTIALLVDDSNWTNNIYTGTAITTQKPGDYYISTTHDYKFFTLSGTVTARRIPFSLL